MAITFRTIEELIEILESRGVKTDEDTARAIERESYYAIVNGYKKPFLDTEKMTESSDDVYKEDTEFRWIYDLFMFDRDLRSITFKYLTRAGSRRKFEKARKRPNLRAGADVSGRLLDNRGMRWAHRLAGRYD